VLPSRWSHGYRVVDLTNQRYQHVMDWMNPESISKCRRGVRTKIIVISLPNAKERRERFRERARNAPVAWSFYPGHTGLHPALHYDEQAAIIAKGRPLSAGELGCFSSHYAAWEKLQSDDADQYVILEDDVIVDWAFIGKLAEVDLADLGISYLRLYYKFPGATAVVRENFIERARSLVELGGTAYGTQGYAITKSGAKVFLTHCRVVTRPVDDEMDRAWVHGQPNLAVFPFPIMEESSGSTIGSARFEEFHVPPHLKLRRFVHYRVERLRRDAARTIRRFRRFRQRQLSKM
jgi:glycosyl transferase family 25